MNRLRKSIAEHWGGCNVIPNRRTISFVEQYKGMKER